MCVDYDGNMRSVVPRSYVGHVVCDHMLSFCLENFVSSQRALSFKRTTVSGPEASTLTVDC